VLPTWLETWYTLEALCALVEFAVLNPGYTFPVLTGEKSGPIIQSKNIGHPLIPYHARVTNSFEIEALGTVILITGSNMSGKSTFLRTVGANLCLAYAGSAVCAQTLQTLPFRLFASMNVTDSLNDGISFFYAEVRRLKALLDALESQHLQPLFFLIDEIFRGTNNRERRIGSEAYLRALAARYGTGLISTHDLDLVRLADEIPMLQNYHFREDVEGDRMIFDYRLHAGPSPTTNALRIMAQAGLPVDPSHLKS
jgi:DNA mismatch repair ATPase MutS